MGGGGNNKKKQKKEGIEGEDNKISLHEKMKNRIMIKKIRDAEQQLVAQKKSEEAQKLYVPYVFEIEGGEKQEKSSALSAPKKNKKKKGKK